MKKVFILSLGMFALGFDAYIVAGLIPGISETYNKDVSQVGLAVSMFTLFYAISAPVFASLLAGKQVKVILLWSMFVFTVANSMTAIAPTFTILLISRAIAGAGAGLFSPLAISASTQLVPLEKKGRAIGLTLGGMSTGTVLGVPLGLYISNLFNWQASLWFLVIVGILAIIGISTYLPQIETPTPPSGKERLMMFLDKKVTITVLITFFASIASLGLYTYLAPLIKEMTSSGNVSFYLWSWGFGGLIGSLMIGYLVDYFKKTKTLVTVILLFLTIAIIFIPIMIDYTVIQYLPFFVWGAMGWASQAPQQHLLISYQPQNGSAAVALNSSLNYLGSSIGATLGGLVLSFGLGAISLIYFAVLSMVVALILQMYRVKVMG